MKARFGSGHRSLSKGFTLRLTNQGTWQCSTSPSAGSFHIEPEVLVLLREAIANPRASEAELEAQLKKSLLQLVKSSPRAQEITALLHDLTQAGILIGSEQNLPGLDDGFGDPWIQWAMLADNVRCQKYWKAIEKATHSKSRVLDLGSGTGLFSLAALESKAKFVTAIEETGTSQSIIPMLKKMGVFDKHRFHLHHTNSVNVKTTLCDVIVHELFGNDPFSEGLLTTLEDAKRFANKGCQWIPFKMEVFAELICLVKGPLADRVQLLNKCLKSPSKFEKSFDKFLYNFAGKYLENETFLIPYHLQKEQFIRLGAPQKVFQVMFDDKPFPPLKTYAVFESQSSRAEAPALVIWFRIWLNKESSLSSHPQEADAASHWGILLSPLPVYRPKNPVKFKFSVEADRLTLQRIGRHDHS